MHGERNASDEKIKDFLEKVGGMYVCLNLLSKLMRIYNLDESGNSTVHKPEHVITELSHKNVWEFTSGEKRKTNTILTCT